MEGSPGNSTTEKTSHTTTIGDAGSSWRMAKLKRVRETAAEEGVPEEVIGEERFGSLEKYKEALAEKKELDRRTNKKSDRKHGRDRSRDRRDSDRLKDDHKRKDRDDDHHHHRHDKDKHRDRDDRHHREDGDKRRKESRHHDHKSDRENRDKHAHHSSSGASSSNRDQDPRQDEFREREERRRSKSGRLSEFNSAASSPFQRPMDEQERQEKELARRTKEKEREKEQEKRVTPIPSPFATHVSSPLPTASEPTITPDQLNKIKAKAMRAKMLGLPDAESLEKEYEAAQKAVNEAVSRPSPESQRVVVVQTMERPSSGSASPMYGLRLGPGNSKAQGKSKKEATHDDQGNRIAYQGEEGDLDLHELLRREKMGLGEDMDQELARRITRDAVFKDDNDYMDDNADKIARTVKKTDEQLKNAAIFDHRKTQTALDSCTMCFKDDGRVQPQMAVVSMGNRIYLGLPLYKEFLPGHCMIVPVQHVTSTLELDDDAWDEIRNFMKCLIQMNAAQDKAVIFTETVINLKWQKHSEAILSADEEWSQHKKLIETDAKDASNGGFRRRLTPKMPFFHVWLGSPDKGYGHVIEDADQFSDYFAKEVLASICEMDSTQWQRRNGKRIPVTENPRRVREFQRTWGPWDWTQTMEGGGSSTAK
ncbi:hypothetical protein BGZ83_007446 [Gryganskiella cystojenkinii]|nr:hypothetical protein BGZ83_007446 [Gryganskiella cystojenkinii]